MGGDCIPASFFKQTGYRWSTIHAFYRLNVLKQKYNYFTKKRTVLIQIFAAPWLPSLTLENLICQCFAGVLRQPMIAKLSRSTLDEWPQPSS